MSSNIATQGRLWTHQDDESRDARLSVLLLATVLAALLRFFALGDHPLWIDEFLTWKRLHPVTGAGFLEQVQDSFQSPLLLAMLWPWTRGELSELVMRIPSAVAGVAMVPLFGVLAGRLTNGRTAEWAVLLMAVSPFTIWFSQDARGYSLALLGSIVATLVLVRMMRDGPTYRTAIGYGIVSGLAMLANNSVLFLVLAHALTVLIHTFPRRGRDWLIWATAFGLAGAIILPWLLKATGVLAVDRLAPGADSGQALRGDTTFSPLALPFAFHSFLYGFSFGPSLFELHSPDRLALLKNALPLLVPAWLVGAFLVVGGWWRMPLRSRLMIMIWIVVPVLCVTILAVRNIKPFNPRYLAVVMPLVLLMLAHGAASWGRPGRMAALLCVGFTLVATGGYLGHARYAREDIRSAVVAIEAESYPGEPVLVPVVSGLYGLYASDQANIVDFWGCPVVRNSEMARQSLADRFAGSNSGWLVLCRSWDLDPANRWPLALALSGEVEEFGQWPGVTVLRWQRTTGMDGSGE